MPQKVDLSEESSRNIKESGDRILAWIKASSAIILAVVGIATYATQAYIARKGKEDEVRLRALEKQSDARLMERQKIFDDSLARAKTRRIFDYYEPVYAEMVSLHAKVIPSRVFIAVIHDHGGSITPANALLDLTFEIPKVRAISPDWSNIPVPADWLYFLSLVRSSPNDTKSIEEVASDTLIGYNATELGARVKALGVTQVSVSFAGMSEDGGNLYFVVAQYENMRSFPLNRWKVEYETSISARRVAKLLSLRNGN